AEQYSLAYRSQFVGETVQVIVERDQSQTTSRHLRHGRCERYFAVHFEAPDARPGDVLPVRIDRLTPTRTHGSLVPAGCVA
ncbi:MAG TPA: TRAM domain-containing protein, partial [Tepidisphaeraceae bacterium]|nr:TRAM domain-containing protein [Tepidisphaeraceae bacterium]